MLAMALLWGALAQGAETLVMVADAETAGQWATGGSQDGALAHDGAASWSFPTTTAGAYIRRWPWPSGSQPVQLDLSAYQAVRFWVHNNLVGDSGFAVLINSENDANGTAGDYYIAHLPTDFTGWRVFTLWKEDFATVRTPLGWDKITNITVSSQGHTPDPARVLHIDSVQAVAGITGPVTGTAGLMAALDLDRPALAAVKTAWNAGDAAGARSALAAYFRTRTAPAWFIDPLAAATVPVAGFTMSASELSTAAGILAGSYAEQGIAYTFPGGAAAVDFTVNPTIAPIDAAGAVADSWVFTENLNRMAEWDDLGRAWWKTGDAAYATAFVSQVRTWVGQNPVPDCMRNGDASRWRTIEAGIRMHGSWPDAWHRFLRAPQFSDDDLLLMLTGFLEHGRYLAAYHTDNNWLTMEASGLYTVGALFPEFREAASWRSTAVGLLAPMVDPASPSCQFLPDGMHREGSTGYHQVAIDNIELAYKNAVQLGTSTDFPAGYIDGLRNAYAFCVRFAGGSAWEMPTVNDAWPVSAAWMGSRARAWWPTDPLFTFATARATATAPEPASRWFPNAGFAVMRTGWRAADHGVWFDAGPIGEGHQHADKLNLIVWPYGRDLLFDGGGGDYDQTANRAYAVSTRSHNTVLVDSYEQARWPTASDPAGAGDPTTPAPVWSSDAAVDWAVGTYQDGWGPEGSYRPAGTVSVTGRHQRQVALLKADGLVVVIDDCTPGDAASHAWQARWHLRTTSTTSTAGVVTTTDAGKANLSVRPLDAAGLTVTRASGQTTPEFIGWDVRKGEADQPATTVVHARTASGPVRFATVLAPIAVGSADPLASVQTITGGWRLVMTNGNQIYVVPVGPAGLRIVRQAGGGTQTTEVGTAVGTGGSASGSGGTSGGGCGLGAAAAAVLTAGLLSRSRLRRARS
jgi:hypothetical protein